jgi:hypothetical protein
MNYSNCPGHAEYLQIHLRLDSQWASDQLDQVGQGILAKVKKFITSDNNLKEEIIIYETGCSSAEEVPMKAYLTFPVVVLDTFNIGTHYR